MKLTASNEQLKLTGALAYVRNSCQVFHTSIKKPFMSFLKEMLKDEQLCLFQIDKWLLKSLSEQQSQKRTEKLLTKGEEWTQCKKTGFVTHIWN